MDSTDISQSQDKGSHDEPDDPVDVTSPSAPVAITGKMYSTDSDLSDWEVRKFGRSRITSPPLVHKSRNNSGSDDHVTPGSPGKRSYERTFDIASFEAAAESVQLSPNKKKHKEQVWTPGKENQRQMMKNWNNSVSSRDSALGSSLFSAFGSILTDSSTSFDSQSNSDDATSSVNTSPVHSVYGRYQKIYTNEKGKGDDKTLGEYENLILHRLPGENLGMILGIEGGKFNSPITGVFVKSVTIGGAAYRATGSSKGIAVGDEILEVNGMDLKEMNREECMTVLKEMPLRVNLMVRRGGKFSEPNSSNGVSQFRQKMKEVSSREMRGCKNQRFMQNYSMTTTSESEDDLLEGFALHKVEVDKNPEESLGISVVPSYGSTREFYQVKRLLPSGAGSRSGQLKVGDRLVSCNGKSLRNLVQAKCLSILKSAALQGDLELEVLRQAENEKPMEISVIVANGEGTKETKVTPKKKEIYTNSGLESESDNDVVLSGFHFNRDHVDPGSVNQVFAQNVKLQNKSPTKQPPQRQTSESNVSDQDSDYSLKSQHQKLIESKMSSSAFPSNSSDSWNMALPPPAEFSDDAGLTSEGGASDTGDENVPATNIDDILSDYAPSISGPTSPELESIRHVKENSQHGKLFTGIDSTQQERRRGNSLTQIQECPQELELSAQNGNFSQETRPINNVEASVNSPYKSMNDHGYDTLKEQKKVMDVFDSYLTSEDDYLSDVQQEVVQNSRQAPPSSNVNMEYQQGNLPSDQGLQDRSADDTQGRNEPYSSYEMKTVILGDTRLGKQQGTTDTEDEGSIVPVHVKRETPVNPTWGKYRLASNIPAAVFDLPESSVDDDDVEDVIVPALIHRDKKPTIYETPEPHLIESPPKEKPFTKPKPKPRKSKSSESEESMEEFVSPVHVKKEDGAKVLAEKLGTDIEEMLIVAEATNNDKAWSGVQLVVMKNKWANAAKPKEDKDSQGGLYSALSSLKSDYMDSDDYPQESGGVTVTSVSTRGDVTVTPINLKPVSKPFTGESFVNVAVEKSHDWPTSDDNSSVEEHIITPRIDDEFMHEKVDKKVSVTVVDKSSVKDRGQSEVKDVSPKVIARPEPTHTTVVCVAEDSRAKRVHGNWDQPLAHENFVTLQNAVLMDTSISSKASHLMEPLSVSVTSPPPLSPTPAPRSPCVKPRTSRSPNRAPVSPVARARSPIPKASSSIARANSPSAKTSSSTARASSPSARASSPVTWASSPIAKSSSPVAWMSSPDARASSPVAKSSSPVAWMSSPDARASSPVARASSPVAKATSPIARASSPVAWTSSSNARASFPVAKASSSLASARSPVSTVRTDVSPGRKSPSPQTVSPMATSPRDKSPVRRSEPITSQISVTKSPTVSPRSSVSTLSPASLSPQTSEISESKEPAKLDQLQQQEPGSQSSTKYMTAVAVKKPSLLSTIRSQTATAGQMKPLSSIKPLKINTNFQPKPVKYSTTINTKPSLLSTLHGSALSSNTGAKTSRSEDTPFQVNVLKGILGLGMKVKVTPERHVQVAEVQSTGPIAKDKNIRVGDYILAINNTELTGLQDSKVQQILRLLPRGLAKITASAAPPTGEEASTDSSGDVKKPPVNIGVLKIDTTEPKVSPRVSPNVSASSSSGPVSPAGPKVTPRAAVLPTEPAKHIITTHNQTEPLASAGQAVGKKLQSTIITNDYQQQATKPDVPKPAPRETKKVTAPPEGATFDRKRLPPIASKVTESDGVTIDRKGRPPIAPKPRLDKPYFKPEPISMTRPSLQSGGYVGSAVGKVRSYDKPHVTEVGSSYSALSSSSSYVPSAKKNVSPNEKVHKDRDPNAPIDTVIFASIGGPNTRTSPPKSGHDDQEPRLIPSGHVDYVMSARPKSSGPVSPRQNSSGSISPKSGSPTDKDSVSQRKINSALSPHKNESSVFDFSSKPTQMVTPAKLHAGNATGFLRSTSPFHTGKTDELLSDTSTPEIDVVTPQTAQNVHSTPTLFAEPSIDVVDTQHDRTPCDSNVESKSPAPVQHDATPSVSNVDKGEITDDIQRESKSLNFSVEDSVEDEVKVTDVSSDDKTLEDSVVDSVNLVDFSDGSGSGSEGKNWSELDASVEVLHEEEVTKNLLSNSSLPNNIEDGGDVIDQSVSASDTESEDDDDAPPPLPPPSSMPVDLSVAKDVIDDILNDVVEVSSEPIPISTQPAVPLAIAQEMLNDEDHSLPVVPLTIAQDMLHDDFVENQLSGDSENTEDSSEDVPSLPPSIPPPLPPSVPPVSLMDLTNTSVDDFGFGIPDGTISDVVMETGDGVVGEGPLLDIPGVQVPEADLLGDLDIYTNSNIGIYGDVSSAPCMSPSYDLLSCDVPSQSACSNMVAQSQPQTFVSMTPETGVDLCHSPDVSSTSYDSVFFQQDSHGFQGHHGDNDDLGKPSYFGGDGNIFNQVEGAPNFVSDISNTKSVHTNNDGDISMSDNSLPEISVDNVDIAFRIDDAKFETKGDNSQDDCSDHSGDILSCDDQLGLPSYFHRVRSGTDTPDTKSLNSLDDLSDTEYSIVKSRRRWSVLMGAHDISIAHPGESVSSDLTLDESNVSLISPEHLALLLDSANEKMDQTGLSPDDEIVVVILHPRDQQTVGVRLTVGHQQEVMVSGLDPNSRAGKDGRMVVGDVLLSANGETLTSENMDDVMEKLDKQINSQTVLVVSKSDSTVPSVTMVTTENDVINPSTEIPDVLSPSAEMPTSISVNGNVELSESSNHNNDNMADVKVNDGGSEVTLIDSPTEVITPPLIPVVPDVVKQTEVKIPPDVISYQMPVFDDPSDDVEKEVCDVIMKKGVTGLGFLIEGGKASPRGDVPLTIRRILKGGPAEKCGQLKVKDEILEINGEDMTQMRHSEAWQHLKFLDDGDVRLKVKRVKVQ